jgi:diguanylate cyclase (GGDEF)-like protein
VEWLAGLAHAGTLLIINALFATLSAVMFGALHIALRKRRYIHGLLWMAVSHACTGAGFIVLVSPVFPVPLLGSTLLGNLLIDLGTTFSLVAFWLYLDRPFRIWPLLVLVSVVGFLEVFDVAVQGQFYRFTVPMGTTLRGILTVAAGVMLWQCRDESRRAAARVGAAFHFLWALTLLTRGLWWLTHADTVARVDPTSSFGLVARLLLTWVITPGFLWMLTRQFDAELVRYASQDALTGLSNRRVIWEHGQRAVADAARRRQRIGVVMIDVDHFKAINDRWGHVGGDEALVAIADRLGAHVPPPHRLGRVGGEEFMVLLLDADDWAAGLVAERLRQAVEGEPILLNARDSLACTVSVGLHVAQPGEPWNEMVKTADGALYAAKRGGRNRVVTSSAADVPVLAFDSRIARG